jgi:hypothetical protein
MRGLVLGIIFTFGLVAGLHGAGATPSAPSPAAVAATASNVLPVAHHCGKGRHWVAAGYAKGGKYRTGHCAPTSASSSSG